MKLKEAVLNGVSLDDSKRERFNEIEQVLHSFPFLSAIRIEFSNLLSRRMVHEVLNLLASLLLQELEKLGKRFDENILDATKRFEKLITDKREIEGLPLSTLALAADTAVLKVHMFIRITPAV